MAGFMSGFGSAFADSFTKARQSSREHEQLKQRDKIRMDFEKSQTEIEWKRKTDAKDAAEVRRANAFIESNNLPKETFGTIYGWREMSDAQIQQAIENNEFTVEKGSIAKSTAPDVEGATDLSQSANSSVETQMAENGMTAPKKGGLFDQDTWGAKATAGRTTEMQERVDRLNVKPASTVKDSMVEKQESPVAGSEDYKVVIKPKTNNMFEKYGTAKNLVEADQNRLRARQSGNPEAMRIAEESFNSVYAMEKIQSSLRRKENGVTDPPMAAIMNPDGTFSGQYSTRKADDGTWLDSNGQPVQNIKEVDNSAIEEMREINKAVSKDVDDYNGKILSLADTYRTAKAGADIIKRTNGSVLTWKGTVSEGLSDFIKNVDDIIDFTKGDNGDNIVDDSEIQNLLSAEDDLMTNLKSNSIVEASDKLAIDRKLFEIYMTKVAYARLRMEDQTGKGVNKEELQNAVKESFAGGNKIAWKTQMDFLLKNAEDNIKLHANQINNSSPMRTFSSTRGYDAPVKPAEDIESQFARDPKLIDDRNQYREIQFGNDPRDIPQPGAPTPETPEANPLAEFEQQFKSSGGQVMVNPKTGQKVYIKDGKRYQAQQ